MSLVDQIRALLERAHKRAVANGWSAGAARTRAARKDLAKPKPDPAPQPWPAIEAARAQSAHGPVYRLGSCQIAVRTCYGVPSVGDFDGDGMADAEDAWKASHGKHPETDPAAIPRGFPVFWGGGSRDNGHVAISTGDGFCWSTDIRRTGFFDRVPIAEIGEKWDLPLLGWVDEYDGHKIVHGAAQ